MVTVEDLMSSRHVAVLDRAVLSLMEKALNGSWSPRDERDDEHAAVLIAAAQLRLYGDRDRSGWFLITTAAARRGLDDGPDAWTVGFIPVLDSFDDAPDAVEVEGQRRLFDDLDQDAAGTLAAALLSPFVTLVVTDEPTRYRHRRPHDLPERLEVIDVVTAARRLGVVPGEKPFVDIPPNQPLASVEPWWVPT